MQHKTLDQLTLSPLIKGAILEANKQLFAAFSNTISQIILIGQVAREEINSDPNSDTGTDIDLLVITNHEVDSSTKDKFFEIAREIEKSLSLRSHICLAILDEEACNYGINSSSKFLDMVRDGIVI